MASVLRTGLLNRQKNLTLAKLFLISVLQVQCLKTSEAIKPLRCLNQHTVPFPTFNTNIIHNILQYHSNIIKLSKVSLALILVYIGAVISVLCSSILDTWCNHYRALFQNTLYNKGVASNPLKLDSHKPHTNKPYLYSKAFGCYIFTAFLIILMLTSTAIAGENIVFSENFEDNTEIFSVVPGKNAMDISSVQAIGIYSFREDAGSEAEEFNYSSNLTAINDSNDIHLSVYDNGTGNANMWMVNVNGTTQYYVGVDSSGIGVCPSANLTNICYRIGASKYSSNIPRTAAGWRNINLSYNGSYITGYVDDNKVFSASETGNIYWIRLGTMWAPVATIAYFDDIYIFSNTSTPSNNYIIYNNKTLNDSTAFLVSPLENLNFSVNYTDDASWVWYINKTNQNNNADYLNFQVPQCNAGDDPSGCIWEVRAEATNATATTVVEWDISSLSTAQAPDTHDSFRDGAYNGRAGVDMWGRNRTNWTSVDSVVNMSWKTARAKNGTTNEPSTLSVNPNWDSTFGTVQFKFRPSNMGNVYATGNNGVRLYAGDGTNFWLLNYAHDNDNHRWLYGSLFNAGGDLGTNGFNLAYDNLVMNGVNIQIWNPPYYGTSWHTIRVVYRPDYTISVFYDGRLMKESFGMYDLLSSVDRLNFTVSSGDGAHPMEFDDVEIYNGRYYNMALNAAYGDVTLRMRTNTSFTNNSGILISGDINLSEINSSINNLTLFEYITSNRTAIISTNLTIDNGAILTMENETLKFNTTANGNLFFGVRNGASLNFSNSTVDTTTDYNFVWHFTNEFDTMWLPYNDLSGSDSGVDKQFRGSIVFDRVTINNSGNFYVVNPVRLYLNNSKFTNLVDTSYTVPSDTFDYLKNIHGSKHAFTLRSENMIQAYSFDNVTFTGKLGGENVTFLSGGSRWYHDIKNSNFSNTELIVSRGRYVISSATETACNIKNITTTVRPINTYFPSSIVYGVLRSNFTNSSIVPYYYLDVLVQYSNGTPVPNANITIINNVNSNYLPQSVLYNYTWTHLLDENARTFPTEVLGSQCTSSYGVNDMSYPKRVENNLTAVQTDSTGHTALPNQSNAVMLAAYFKNATEQTNFTYNIFVNVAGYAEQTKTVTVDDTWYRADPSTYQNTTTFVFSESNNTYPPPPPTNLSNKTGNFWVNHTWEPGAGNVTNSYNVSVNGTWTNGSTSTYSNNSVGAHGYSNIIVRAYNSSGGGSLDSETFNKSIEILAYDNLWQGSVTSFGQTITAPVGMRNIHNISIFSNLSGVSNPTARMWDSPSKNTLYEETTIAENNVNQWNNYTFSSLVAVNPGGSYFIEYNATWAWIDNTNSYSGGIQYVNGNPQSGRDTPMVVYNSSFLTANITAPDLVTTQTYEDDVEWIIIE